MTPVRVILTFAIVVLLIAAIAIIPATLTVIGELAPPLNAHRFVQQQSTLPKLVALCAVSLLRAPPSSLA
jgi:hypothetical protein